MNAQSKIKHFPVIPQVHKTFESMLQPKIYSLIKILIILCDFTIGEKTDKQNT